MEENAEHIATADSAATPPVQTLSDADAIAPVRNGDRPRAVSLKDVAKAAEVSIATVSMVLNANPRISRATSAKVQRVIEKMGYKPNRIAQALSRQEVRVLGILLPHVRHAFADAYFGELISGICDRAAARGFKVNLEQAREDFIAAKRHVEIFERRFVDGVLCLGTNDTQQWLMDFADFRWPVLLVDNRVGQLDYVGCDYRLGAEQAMNYLLQLGHQKIGLLFAAPEISTIRDVRDVYRSRLSSAGVEAAETWIEDGEFTEAGGAAAAERLRARHPDLTALLCCNDKMAIGAIHYLTRSGVRVPQDISILGFDDLQQAAYVNPALTTIHLPLYEVGIRAVDLLIDRIRGQHKSVADLLTTHLVVRDSTAISREHHNVQ